MEPTNQPFRKENDLNQASIFVEFHVNLPGCCIQPPETCLDDKEIPSRFQQPSAHPFPMMSLTGDVTQGSKVESHKELLLEARLLPKETETSIPEE